ncbi:MAG TPA: hypothetical protein VJB14_14665, partial [Planctomycetota bacterium]|nr:hypothetical protein [Planctomycetota bacterium]
ILNRVYVSCAGSGTVSVIHGDLLDVVNTISLPGATNLGGICLSEDRQALFVAGRNGVAGEAGIWRINLPAETSTYLGGVATAGTAADCDVIRAAQVGGTGDAPGKVYFTIPGTNQVGVYDATTGTMLAPLTILAITPDFATNPTGIDRAPDHSFLLFGVSSTDTNQRIGRIIPGPGPTGDAIDTVTINNAGGAPRLTRDVVFRPGASPFQTYIYGEESFTTSRFVYDVTVGAATPGPLASATVNLASNASGFGISFDLLDNVLWVGAQNPATDTQIQGLNAAVSPPTLGPGPLTFGLGPGKVDFLLQPKAPTIAVACPKGQIDTAAARIIVRGNDFQPNSRLQVDFAAAPAYIPTIFVNSNTLVGDVSGLGGNLYDILVQNKDLQTARLNSYYQSIVGPGLTPGFPINLPPFASGYEMMSFPQYATVDELKLALQQQVGPYNPVFYRVFIWYQDHYVELNKISNLVDDCDLSGRAFFVLTRFGHPLTLSSLDVTGNAAGTDHVVPLTQGWNMISQPWLNVTHTIPWVQVDVSLNSDLSNPLPAPGGAFLSPLPYERINHQYVTVNALTAGRGYWVYNYSGVPAYLIFRQGRVSKPGDPPPVYTAMAPGDPGPPPPPDDVASESSSSSGGGCGFLGPELLLLALAFHRLSRRRRLGV